MKTIIAALAILASVSAASALDFCSDQTGKALAGCGAHRAYIASLRPIADTSPAFMRLYPINGPLAN